MKRKGLLLIAVLAFVICEQGRGQAPGWEWARSAGGGSTSGITTDVSGNVFITGSFGDSITFTNTTLFNSGLPWLSDIYLAKYDALGNLLWATSEGANEDDYSSGICTAPNGDVYIIGTYYAQPINFGGTNLYNAGNEDIFLVKYNSSGNVINPIRIGGTGVDEVTDITTDALGNVYVTGYFSSLSFYLGGFTYLTNADAGNKDLFIAKFDMWGDIIWAQNVWDEDNEYSYAVATDEAGSVYITGSFDSPSTNFGSTVLTNAGSNDFFITKYDSSGKVIWAQSAGGSAIDAGTRIATDAVGNLYVSGYFTSDSLVFGNTLLLNKGSTDLFLVKYDSAGNVLWANTAGGSNNDYISSITTDSVGNLYVTGSFTSDSIQFGNMIFTNAGSSSSRDMFIANYDASGNLVWAITEGDSLNESCSGLTIDAMGNIYVSGYFTSPVFTLGSHSLPNSGMDINLFVAKLSYGIPTINSHQNNITNSLKLYPNPASSHLTIAFGGVERNVEVSIADITGKVVYTATSSNTQQMEVSTKDLSAGMYLVQVKSGDWMETRKVVVVK